MAFPAVSLSDVETRQYRLEVLTEHYLIQCAAEPVGMLMTYLDSPERSNFQFKNVVLTGLAVDSTVNSIKMKELWVQRSEVIMICLDESDLQGNVQKLPAKESLRIFLPRFVVQGTFTRGEDTRQGDMFEVIKGSWAAIYDAQVFPLTTLKAHPFREAPFLLVNKDRISFYEVMSKS
jgi:hypothetical protein